MKSQTPSYRSFVAPALLIVLVVLAGAFALHAKASIRIQIIGAKHNAGQPMSVRLTNDGKDPASICTACAGAIIDPRNPIAPNFNVEKQSGKDWLPVAWGADTPNCDTTRVIPGGESSDFQIKLNEPGHYRLKIAYATGKLSDADAHKKCADIAAMAQAKVATSPEFDVVAN